MPEQLLSLVARRFHLLAEPMRLRLLDRLRDGEATVHQLADELGTSQQNVSKSDESPPGAIGDHITP
jgi:DNA-binding transcriptional ArsR family regulator